MPKFDCKNIDRIKARERVEQLFIDGIGQLDDLQNRLTGTTYNGEFIGLIAFIEHFANGGNPGKKVKYLSGVTDSVTEYEFISKHLRIYAIQQPSKKIVIYGGIKKAADSSDNISRFRAIKNEFLVFLKNKNDQRSPFKK